jgi:hypothetical protein
MCSTHSLRTGAYPSFPTLSHTVVNHTVLLFDHCPLSSTKTDKETNTGEAAETARQEGFIAGTAAGIQAVHAAASTTGLTFFCINLLLLGECMPDAVHSLSIMLFS